MNVRTLCLAILTSGDATGYEIRKLVADGHFGHFVDASYGSIYPALARLHAERLCDVHNEEQDGRPTRKVYSINEKGRAAFAEMLSRPAQPDVFKSEFLLLAMFAQFMSVADVERAIDAQVRRLVDDLEMIDRARASVDLAGADWVAEYGRTCLQTQLDFIYERREALVAAAGTARATPVLLAAE